MMAALIRPFAGKSPEFAGNNFIADNASVIGDVWLGPDVNIWYGAVLRGDVGSIRIGARSNIQDLACIHMTLGQSCAEIAEDVTVGHGAIIHGASVGAGALIGMGAILLDNCEIGAESVVAAGTIVSPRTRVPPRCLVLGQPGRVIRELKEEEWNQGRQGAERYLELARVHSVAQR